MSSRTGRGGKGGRGYIPPSGAQLYLKRSAQEAGLDDRNLRNLQDITKPDALFPSLKWHSNGTIWNEEDDDDDDGMDMTATKRSASTVYLIQKGREMRSRMKAMYQVRPKQEQDVLRYHTKNQKNTDTSPSIAAKRLGPLYVPQELLPTAAKKQKTTDVSSPEKGTATADFKHRATNLTELEKTEQKRRSEVENEEDVALLDQGFEQSDEEDEAADYTMNYYESEDEDSNMGGGDGGEPTF